MYLYMRLIKVKEVKNFIDVNIVNLQIVANT